MLSSLFFYRNFKQIKNFDILPEAYYTFKLKWHFNIYLTNNKKAKNYFKSVYLYAKLFKRKFYKYHLYSYYNINEYNIEYFKKTQLYRRRVLTKISNLKRFFYYRNKKIKG
jgi:hypothetical protein